MNYLELRQKYPVFSYDKYYYDFENNSLNIKYYYSCGEFTFIHKLNIPTNKNPSDWLVFNIGLSLIPSYWKLFCSPTIQINSGHWILSTEHLNFWKKLMIKGMGEYYYKNQIDFTKENFLKFEIGNNKSKLNENWKMKNEKSGTILVPVGGGKDSIVTLELLKPHYQVTAFAINPVPVITETVKTSGVPSIYVDSQFDPKLFDLNKNGFLNGHTPISAFYAFTGLLAAYLHGIPHVVLSNERSTSEGNTTYLGHEINHQYSKTLEFETDLNNYVSSPKYFSFLRPLYELQITKLFSNYPQYINVFSSCNNNFKMLTKQEKLWCCQCPKCVSTALMFSQFIGKEKVVEIMGSYPPDLPSNLETINQLTGKSPVKPFECVLTRVEANACVTGEGLNEILSSWLDNPNMPEEFKVILQSSTKSFSLST